MLEINWQILVSQVITFLIALVVVWKFAWKPILQIIHDRQDKVRKTLEDAENMRLAITKLEAEYQAKLQQVEQKSAEFIAIATAGRQPRQRGSLCAPRRPRPWNCRGRPTNNSRTSAAASWVRCAPR